MNQFFRCSLFVCLALFAFSNVMAQVPRNVPQPGSDQQLDLQSPWHIIFFIALPLFMIAYLFYTITRKPKSDSEQEEESENEKND